MSKHDRPKHESLADVLKDDSKVISLAIEDSTQNRSNWSEFFDTIGSFLKTFDMKIVGIDKGTYAKMVKERVERLRAQAQVTAVEPEAKTPEIITTEKEQSNGPKEIIIAKS